jgi:hypothetical protein
MAICSNCKALRFGGIQVRSSLHQVLIEKQLNQIRIFGHVFGIPEQFLHCDTRLQVVQEREVDERIAVGGGMS